MKNLFEIAKSLGFNDAQINESKEYRKIRRELLEISYAKQDADKLKVSYKTYLKLKEKSGIILDMFRTGYSMGEYKSMHVKGTYVIFNKHILRTYSRSCKYKPTYGSIKIVLSLSELKSIQIIEGVPTIKLKNNRCKWLQSSGNKGGYGVSWEYGWLVGKSHSAVSLAHALELDRARTIKLLSGKRFVGYQDLKAIGACDPGIVAFCTRFGLNSDYGYSVEYLKEIAPEFNHYFNRLQKHENATY